MRVALKPCWPMARLAALLAGLGALLTIVLVLSLANGLVAVPRADVLSLLSGGTAPRASQILALDVRLPRFLVGALSGAALGATGCLMQAALQNDLAEPGLLGVSSGAALAVACVVVLELPLPPAALTGFAMLGGLGAGLLVLLLARGTRDPVRIILLGAALSALFAALTVLLLTLGSPVQIQAVYTYLAGSLTGRDWSDLTRVLPWLGLGLPAALLAARPLNVLRLGEEVAEGLGVRVLRLRVLAFGLAVAVLAPVIAVAGPVGFVALLAPHMTRRLLRTGSVAQVMPAAMLVGACLLSAGDLVARTVAPPTELPVGLIVAAVGAPATILLLRRQALAPAPG